MLRGINLLTPEATPVAAVEIEVEIEVEEAAATVVTDNP